uniref:ubiquitin-associated domain-containing protein 1 isoform X2 n=1 Tax=Myxine glutinosa TaxID=7769 RepID=UPI00358EB96B
MQWFLFRRIVNARNGLSGKVVAAETCETSGLDDPKSLSQYRIIHVSTERELNGAFGLGVQDVQDRDVLVILKKQSHLTPTRMVAAEEKTQKSPDKDAISRATADLVPKNSERSTATPPSFRDFHTELRRIIISLIDVAQKLLALNPEAIALYRNVKALEEDDDDQEEFDGEGYKVDDQALQQLLEMGFPVSRAQRALQQNQMSVTQAMEWLIEHDGISPTLSQSQSSSSMPHDEASPPSPAPQRETAGSSTASRSGLDELTEVFRRIRWRKEFKPNPTVLASLLEMGFEEEAVISALRHCNNQQDAACEWLLGEEQAPVADEGGVDPQGPLFQAILENPVVQLGLSNPKLLLAFEDMLQNPLNSTQWMNDPETGPVMLQISRIFQTLNRQ